MPEPHITQKMLKKILRYDRRTGLFHWRVRSDVQQQWNTRYAGKAAGSNWSPDGKTLYRVITIFDWPFLAHRLAILYVTGRWPRQLVDHHDLNGLNNRWKNLRSATQAQNGANRGANKNSKTAVKGVSPYRGRFRATIQVDGKWRQIGIFDTKAIAAEARRLASESDHGEFARA